jgi:hypothetical protein
MLKFIYEQFNISWNAYNENTYEIYINNMTDDIKEDIEKILFNVDNDIKEKIKELIKDIDPLRKKHFETLLEDFVIEKIKPETDFQYNYHIMDVPEDKSHEIKKLLLTKGYTEFDFYYEIGDYSTCGKETVKNKGMIDNSYFF